MNKNQVLGSILAICGSILSGSIIIASYNNIASYWETPPGRFIFTILENNLEIPLIISIILIIIGIVILVLDKKHS